MVVLGVDPGTRVAGYAFLKTPVTHSVAKVLEFGTIQCDTKKELPHRIGELFQSLNKLVIEYKPDAIALEDVFYSKFVRSALALGHARGAVMAAASFRKITVFEYAPRQVKQSATGRGSASKDQVAQMMKMHLQLAELPESSDATDALAVAYCHISQQKQMAQLKESCP